MISITYLRELTTNPNLHLAVDPNYHTLCACQSRDKRASLPQIIQAISHPTHPLSSDVESAMGLLLDRVQTRYDHSWTVKKIWIVFASTLQNGLKGNGWSSSLTLLRISILTLASRKRAQDADFEKALREDKSTPDEIKALIRDAYRQKASNFVFPDSNLAALPPAFAYFSTLETLDISQTRIDSFETTLPNLRTIIKPFREKEDDELSEDLDTSLSHLAYQAPKTCQITTHLTAVEQTAYQKKHKLELAITKWFNKLPYKEKEEGKAARAALLSAFDHGDFIPFPYSHLTGWDELNKELAMFC